MIASLNVGHLIRFRRFLSFHCAMSSDRKRRKKSDVIDGRVCLLEFLLIGF